MSIFIGLWNEIFCITFFTEVSSVKSINSLGLILEVVGVLLLFKFGLPSKIDIEGQTFIVSGGIDEKEKIKAKRYKTRSYIALTLLIFGFLLQIISNHLI